MGLNVLILMGKLITDPEMTYSRSGIAVTKFRMQTDNTGNRPADLHSVITFGKQGDDGLAGRVAQHFAKGSNVIVQGRHSEQEFESKNGKKFLSCQIVAFSVSSESIT